MFFNLCILVHWTKVALALEGLKDRYHFDNMMIRILTLTKQMSFGKTLNVISDVMNRKLPLTATILLEIDKQNILTLNHIIFMNNLILSPMNK